MGGVGYGGIYKYWRVLKVVYDKNRGFLIRKMYWEGDSKKDFGIHFSISSEIRGILYYPENACGMS
jgi:hypothetical protein